MILKASQRAGGAQLARHLMNVDDNDHVELYELRGFVAETIEGAFQEAYAISRGTKCKQFLFSLSLSPPENERASIQVFEDTIAKIENQMGLANQPRATVFHEKQGRRHAHCVWSRIDMESMTAINLPHYKYKLKEIARELYLEHGWQMPRGFENPAERDPLSFSLVEWQQAKRAKQDPRVIKQIFQRCWQQSDSVSAFAASLKERGFWLARGDRRGHVAMDWRGEVYTISRWSGIKAKEVRVRLGDPSRLPSVEKAKIEIAERYAAKLKKLIGEVEKQYNAQLSVLASKRAEMTKNHRIARKALVETQAIREISETKERSDRLPTGLKAIWFRLTGKYRTICNGNQRIYEACRKRDRSERETLINQQLRERRKLQHEFQLLRHRNALTVRKLHEEIRQYLEMSDSVSRRIYTSDKRRRGKIQKRGP